MSSSGSLISDGGTRVGNERLKPKSRGALELKFMGNNDIVVEKEIKYDVDM